MVGPTGGIQGDQGRLFGTPYAAGTWVDQVIEAFSGPHDLIGGKLSGLYDAMGNAKRGRSPVEKKIQNAWSATGAIAVAAPFAASTLWSPELWKALSVVLGGGK